MSRLAARNARDQIVGRPALVAHQYVTPTGDAANGGLSPMMADLNDLENADHAAEQAAMLDRRASLASAYFEDSVPEQNKPFAFANGYAIIPIHGFLLNRFSWSWGFVTGYNFIRSQVQAAEADDDVTGIIFDVNSYGGLVTGCRETADVIAAGKKPSVAVVDANCYSAAYFLAAQANAIRVTPSGGVGGIGVVMMHADYSGLLDQAGIKVTYIFAGSHKVDGNTSEPLSDDVKADFQAKIDAIYDVFVEYAATGRGLDEQEIRDTEAACYNADDALTVGLIDAIHNASDEVESYFATCDDGGGDDTDDGDDPPAEPEESDMKPPVVATATAAAPEDNTAQLAQAASDARTAERARISGITGHAEAEGRADLASHLAYNTDMTVEAAAAILKAAPKAATAPAAETTGASGPQQETNRFKTSMDGQRQPDIGAGAAAPGTGEDASQDNQTPAQRILATAKRAGVLRA